MPGLVVFPGRCVLNEARHAVSASAGKTYLIRVERAGAQDSVARVGKASTCLCAKLKAVVLGG